MHDHREAVARFLGGEKSNQQDILHCKGCYEFCREIPRKVITAIDQGDEPEDGFFLVNEALNSAWSPSVERLLAQPPAPLKHGSVLWCPADSKITLIGMWPELAGHIVDVSIRVQSPYLRTSLGYECLTVTRLEVDHNGKVEIPVGMTDEWEVVLLVGQSDKGSLTFTASPHE